MLKIFEKSAAGGDPATFLFHFHSDQAKAEAKAVKELLAKLLAGLRSNDPGLPRASAGTPGGAAGTALNGDAGPSPAASMAFASAVSSQPMPSARWFDDNQLKNDIELQQSLMKKDQSLHRTYMEGLSTKPDAITAAAFNSQFWSTRTNLLRAHAIELNQKKGAYNVLSTVKPRSVEGELKLNISVEQVQMILSQHPLVKRIYNENVPKVSEAQFWSRFFLSRLSKKLRGEHVTDNDATDPLFDRHDVSEDTEGFQSKVIAQSVRVPHIIDLEANEENQDGFRGGNARDVEMRPRANIPIVMTLNCLSEKIMANVAPSDANLDDAGGTLDTYSELALRDLQGDAQEHRIMLNVKEQNKFFRQEADPCPKSAVFAKQDPAEALSTVQASLATLGENQGGSNAGGIDLRDGIGFDEDSASDDDTPKKPHVGSRAAIAAAEMEVTGGLHQQRAQKYGHACDDTTPMGLTAPMAEKCALTHATTIEFLHQFWTAFLSGDADRAAELQYLSESLRSSAARINAVADEAEQDRETVIRRRKTEIREHYERTGKKIRWKSDMVGGGRDAVLKLMRPALDALVKAQAEYSRALAAEGIQVSTES